MCRILTTFEAVTRVAGPIDDVLHITWRVTSGQVEGVRGHSTVVAGLDFMRVFADEKFEHDGRLVISDPSGDVLLRYDGTTDGVEGTYDGLMEGQFPGESACRLTLKSVSQNRYWKGLNREPLYAVGTFDPSAGKLDIVLYAVER